MTIPEIVKKYRGAKSLRTFAGELSERLFEPISHQTVKFWEDGTYTPRYYSIQPIALHYEDWRRDFAIEVINAIVGKAHEKGCHEAVKSG